MKRLPCKAELANAIRIGAKTETRRLISPQPLAGFETSVGGDPPKPRYAVGEVIGITEPWRTLKMLDGFNGTQLVAHRAKCLETPIFFAGEESMKELGRPRLARFLPDAFVRTRVEIVGVEAQRVQEIGKDGAKAKSVLAEGITEAQIDLWRKWLHPDDAPAHAFGVLWDTLHPEHPWASNPWVWRYCFRRVV